MDIRKMHIGQRVVANGSSLMMTVVALGALRDTNSGWVMCVTDLDEHQPLEFSSMDLLEV